MFLTISNGFMVIVPFENMFITMLPCQIFLYHVTFQNKFGCFSFYSVGERRGKVVEGKQESEEKQ